VKQTAVNMATFIIKLWGKEINTYNFISKQISVGQFKIGTAIEVFATEKGKKNQKTE
jgi:hypothetical protein